MNFLNIFHRKEKCLSCLHMSPTLDGLELPAANVLCNCYFLNLFDDNFLTPFHPLSTPPRGSAFRALNFLIKVQSAEWGLGLIQWMISSARGPIFSEVQVSHFCTKKWNLEDKIFPLFGVLDVEKQNESWVLS